jgi:tRNA(fMet)-specific endonuclease VapC
MGCVIDSCVLILWEKSTIDLNEIINQYKDELFYLSVISASELLHGVHRAKNKAIRNRRSAFVEEVLRQFPILEIDLNAARSHADIWADLVSKGQIIGGHDLWIAASCLAHGHSIITDNTKEFSRVEGLTVIPVSSPPNS